MVGPPYDCLANPLGAVRFSFEKAVASGSDLTSFDGKDWGAVELFRQFLFDHGHLSQVPILNSATVKWVQPNTLVRFRGMIQDMLGNEFYVGAYKDGLVWRTNKFMEASQFPVGSSPDMRIWERRLLYCVPVPGQSSWTEPTSEAVLNQHSDWKFQHREKRQREVLDDGSPSTKKMREDGHPCQSAQSQESVTEGACLGRNDLPDVGNDPLPCLVMIYDSPESDLKLNDVFEFVGVLTFDSELTVDDNDKDEFSNEFGEDMSISFPSNKVPRLHCFIHRKLSVQDFLHSSLIMEPQLHLVKEIREALLGHLTAVLGNDGVAAHFLLLHLLSKVHARVDTVAVGKLSINLTCFTMENVSIFGTRLSLAIKNLLPFTHRIPLRVEYLNTASLAPKKDYQTNRLITGALQLADGSHLTIDETQLEAGGTLNSLGVENVTSLKNLMELQKVDYDFKYYKMEMAADVQVLILSEGKSNILPADLVLPFQPSSMGSSDVLVAKALEACRWYLTTVRSLPHSIEPEIQTVVENDLVAARQANRGLGSQDFSRWLTMGRLMSASFGETCLSLEHWQMVKELERLRRERVK